KHLSQFNAGVQASISRTDTAALATAFSLGIAAQAPNASAGLSSVSDGKATANATINVPDPKQPPEKDKTKLSAGDTPAIEPTLLLNQHSTFLNHLHELRRINEGDDNADSPGYALNLIRIPVSILTGSHTLHGHGAEFTATITPHLTDDLLPATFRNLVVRDLVDLLTLPIAQYIGAEDMAALDCGLEEFDKSLLAERVRKPDVSATRLEESLIDSWSG